MVRRARQDDMSKPIGSGRPAGDAMPESERKDVDRPETERQAADRSGPELDPEPEPAPEGRRHRNARAGRLRGAVRVVEAFAAGCVAAAVLAVFVGPRLGITIPGAQAAPKVDVSVLETKISRLNELATVSYEYSNADVYTDSNKLFGVTLPFTSRAFITQYEGTIRAGVNLDAVQVSLDDVAKTVTVALPEAQILSHDVRDLGTTYEDSNVFVDMTNPLDPDAKRQLEEANREKMEQTAVDAGILTQAHDNAETSISALLEGALPEGYSVAFADEADGEAHGSGTGDSREMDGGSAAGDHSGGEDGKASGGASAAQAPSRTSTGASGRNDLASAPRTDGATSSNPSADAR